MPRKIRINTSFDVVVHEEPSGGYWAEVPALPGCFSEGETLAEVRENVKEAIALYVRPDPAPGSR